MAAAAVDDGENNYGADEGDRHEEERGGGLSEGCMDVEHLFDPPARVADDGAEGVDSESLSLSLSFTTLGITDSTDSTYLQSQSSKINKGGAGGNRCGI